MAKVIEVRKSVFNNYFNVKYESGKVVSYAVLPSAAQVWWDAHNTTKTVKATTMTEASNGAYIRKVIKVEAGWKVTYLSGVVRTYKNLPKTAQNWMAVNEMAA